jgi:hypothetical protein
MGRQLQFLPNFIQLRRQVLAQSQQLGIGRHLGNALLVKTPQLLAGLKTL